MTLHIFRIPYSLASAHDILGECSITTLNSHGLAAYAHDLWPDKIAAFFNSGQIPFGRRIFNELIAPRAVDKSTAVVGCNDVAWVLGSMVPLATKPVKERKLKDRVKKYFYHVMDNWLAIPHLREGVLSRCALADVVIVPTPQIEEAVRDAGILTPILRLEEPIDVERLNPDVYIRSNNSPFVVWCGNPQNIIHLERLLPSLNEIYTDFPFTLRVVSDGNPSAKFRFAGRVDWFKYDRSKEACLLAGAVAGLAPLEDSPYNRCKGAYKIKTYLAAGVPVVASDTGFQKTLMERSEVGMLARNPDEFAEAIKYLLLNADIQYSLSKKARETAVARYAHSHIIPQWIEKLKMHY